MKNLKITLVQTDLLWENPSANLEMIQKKVSSIKKSQTDLIMLPEMFPSGFTMNVKKVADTMNGVAVEFMTTIAKQKNAVVCGSVVIKEKNKFYNRLIWAQPDGQVLHYDKRHLFRMADEHKTFAQGNKKLFINLKGWNVCPLVCYDLRFPVWSRSRGEVDLMLYVANWPTRRIFAWNHLLVARAIENQCYVAAVNRVGDDGNKINYSGESVVLNAMGEKLSNFKTGKEAVANIEINSKDLLDYRKNFPVMMDADNFKITK